MSNLSFEDDHGRRPVLVVAVDTKTRVILGCSVSFESPSSWIVRRALKNAIFRKDVPACRPETPDDGGTRKEAEECIEVNAASLNGLVAEPSGYDFDAIIERILTEAVETAWRNPRGTWQTAKAIFLNCVEMELGLRSAGPGKLRLPCDRTIQRRMSHVTPYRRILLRYGAAAANRKFPPQRRF